MLGIDLYSHFRNASSGWEKKMNKVSLTNEQLRQIQSVELQLLCSIDQICKKNNIKYILSYGTLLGCIRHNGFIPWDDDVDICILRKDLDRFRFLCQKELGENYFYQSHKTDKEYYYLWDKIRINGTLFKETFDGKYNIHHGIFIDVFPIDTIPNDDSGFLKQYIMFKFFKIGLMAKYVDISARSGKKNFLRRY